MGVAIAGAMLTALAAVAHAQQLPKSGSIEFHTGWKYSVDAISPAEKHVIGRGNVTGVTFNNKGSGPLHLGPANCFEAFFGIDGSGQARGYCAFGDPDGDRLFTQFTGSFGADGANGTNEIAGGTGKYTGITGSGPWKCKPMGGNGEVQCAQRLDYKLP
jgi:hypothetical protein